jgi:hypothetical protein
MGDIDKSFVPTTEWMTEKYDEMNNQLFGGRLMECGFEVFTKGAGMEGRVLGWFCITAKNIRVIRDSRRIFKQDVFGITKVDRDNFVEVCKPVIKLNGNYHGTEHAFLATLVHEMCHYYTYMNGYAPVQSNGREFKEIGAIVSARSKGMFSIQRLASAEEMKEMSLNPEMKAKKAKRLANKKAGALAVVVYKKNGQIRLIITKNGSLVYQILNIEQERPDTIKIIKSDDTNLIERLFDKGYNQLMRKYSYWEIDDDKEAIKAIEESDYKELYENENLAHLLGGQALSVKSPTVEKKPIKIFTIRTKNGTFEYPVKDEYKKDLIDVLKERFPKLNMDSIMKIINNPANYRDEKK